ncbi:hypothetical protein CRM22_009940 [Opisthorchis felineus]|uniref:C2 domain-containing protein n=1 Tax=Opisthorchis felineus TaxID=147828 RepID=A0A4S2L3S0_OPIFE|nr:hypothetical protein CRM22_009940 [Opisthorchis felineus]
MPSRPRIQIGISCTNLPTKLPGSYAKFSVAHGGTLHEKHVTETEIQRQTRNPIFLTRLNLEYFFEERQIITSEIFQCEREDREDSQLLGFGQCTVGRVIHSGGELELPLICNDEQKNLLDPGRPPSVFVCIREDPFSKENIYLKMQGFNLDKKDFFGKSDPYVTIYRRNERGKLQKAYRSEVIKNTLFPDFRPILVCLDRLCGGNVDCELCFRCFDWDGALGDSEEVDTELDDLIGEFTTTISELLRSDESGLEFKLINPPKKKRKKNYQDSGQLKVRLSLAQSNFSFLDYIFGGTSINVVIGVDLSNHISSKQMPASRQIEVAQSCNEYSVAIQAVMEILQEYDSDQLFPAYGFGSRLSSGGKICHKYPLSGDENNYFCKGMAGVLEAYRRSFEALHLSGPICFSPIIRDVSDTARRNKDTENYYVLLILTNGTVDDWIETKKAVIETSFLPISIIVIGIGGGKFADMEILDQDFGLLKVGQEQACRDNVQFVQMRRFLRLAADGSDNLRWSKVGLAKEVLAELPSQILDYFERNHLLPCHSIPGQPKLLKDLVDPGWWRAFTQPDTSQVSEEFSTTVQTAQTSTETTASSNNKGRMQLPAFHTNASEHSNVAVRTCSVPTKHDQSVVQEFKTLHIDRSWDGKISGRTIVSRDPNSTLDYGQSEDPSDHFGATRSGVSSLQIRRQMSLGPSMHGASPVGRRIPNPPKSGGSSNQY